MVETLLKFVLAVLCAHLRPEGTISISKTGETLVIFVLVVLGAHLRPECTIYIPKRGDMLVNFVLVVLGTHLRNEGNHAIYLQLSLSSDYKIKFTGNTR